MKKMESDSIQGVLDISMNAEKRRQRERMVIIVDNDTIHNSQFFFYLCYIFCFAWIDQGRLALLINEVYIVS